MYFCVMKKWIALLKIGVLITIMFESCLYGSDGQNSAISCITDFKDTVRDNRTITLDTITYYKLKQVQESQFAGATPPDTIWATHWIKGYLRYVETHKYIIEHYSKWGLSYIDDDNVPELIFQGDCESSGSLILTQYNGNVSRWQHWRRGCGWIERSGLITHTDGYQDHEWEKIILLKKGVFKVIYHYDAIYESHFDSISRAFVTDARVYTVMGSDTIRYTLLPWGYVDSLFYENADSKSLMSLTWNTEILIDKMFQK